MSSAFLLPVHRSVFHGEPRKRLLSSIEPKNRQFIATKSVDNDGTAKRSIITGCVEVPQWKKGPIDIDFEKDEQLELLEDQLGDAITQENYKLAAELREKLVRLQSGSYVSVLSANLKFYKAFTNGSIVDMAGCWLQDKNSTCKLPFAPLSIGYMNILNSFGYFFSFGVPIIDVRNVQILMRGSAAIVTCEEHTMAEEEEPVLDEKGNTIERPPIPLVMLATNIFVKNNSQWYLVHHTSNPILLES